MGNNQYNSQHNNQYYEQSGSPYQGSYISPKYYNAPSDEAPKHNGFAIASLVLGIISLLSCCAFYSFAGLPSILSIIFSFIDRSQNGKMSGMGIAGLICGILSLLLVIAFFAFLFFIIFAALAEDPYSYSSQYSYM